MKAGARVKWSDANADSIPAYRDMRGTVQPEGSRFAGCALSNAAGVIVRWDCDGGVNSWVALAWIVEVTE